MTWNPAPTAPAAAPMGWYPTPRDQLRWWDGRAWTAMRMRAGRLGIDAFATEQPNVAVSFGCVFLALGLMQAGLAGVSQAGGYLFPGLGMFMLSVLWFLQAAAGFGLRRIPAPSSAPAYPDLVRPLPGEQEGYGAGWYAMTPRVTRWWTGARWSEYTASNFGVRPNFHGARSVRIFLAVVWVFVGLGSALLLAGILTFAVVPGSYGSAVAVVLCVAGLGLGLVAVVLACVLPTQRRALIAPRTPPGVG